APRVVRDGGSARCRCDGRGSALRSLPEIADEKVLRELRRDAGERLEIVEGRAAPLEVAGAQAARHELLEQGRLTTRGRAEGAQVPGIEPMAREATAGGRDV